MRAHRRPGLRHVGLAGVALLSGACNSATLAATSAPYVGCSADEITVSDEGSSHNEQRHLVRWQATCRGRVWSCTDRCSGVWRLPGAGLHVFADGEVKCAPRSP